MGLLPSLLKLWHWGQKRADSGGHKGLYHTSLKNPQIQKLLEKCHELLAYKEIALCWIPSHIGGSGWGGLVFTIH